MCNRRGLGSKAGPSGSHAEAAAEPAVVPQHLRVHFSAVCSFFTLAAMSVLQGRLEKRRGVEPE